MRIILSSEVQPRSFLMDSCDHRCLTSCAGGYYRNVPVRKGSPSLQFLQRKPRRETDRVSGETRWPPVFGKGGKIKRSRLLLYCSILTLSVAAGLFVLFFAGAKDEHVLTVDEVMGLPGSGGSFRSINNWETVETTDFEGVPFTVLLKSVGVTSPDATVRIIAPDEYFWPAVGDTLTVRDLGEKNGEGLTHLLAYEMNREALDPEPDGTGPLRYVAPQFSPDETNKPSWVSNVRVIEVGPVPNGYEPPDPKKVPVNTVWIVGDVPPGYPFSIALPVAVGCAGLALLAVFLVTVIMSKRSPGKQGAALAALLAACLVAGLAIPSGGAQAQATATFSLAELKAMPAFTGSYTFLKQLPPYTYYEQEYTGVPLSYLLNERLRPAAGASGVVVRARDGYTATLSMEQVNKTYPGNLKVIIAYAKDGGALEGDEGPLRLIVPQNNPGKHDQGGDPNTPLCGRMIFAVEVTPVPGGVSAPSPDSVASGSLAVYGAVTPAPAPSPSPSPPPSPEPQPREQQPASDLMEAPAAAGETVEARSRQVMAVTMLNEAFRGKRGFGSWVVGSAFAGALPGTAGLAFWLLFQGAVP